jgi:hypothetical protein
MTRLLAAALVVACALTLNLAQEKTPVLGRGSSSLPFEITAVDGKPAWIVTGRGTIYVEDLVGGLANAHSMRVSFTARATESRRAALGYLAPDSGLTLKNEQLPAFVSDLLAGQGLTLVGFTQGNARIARIEEAASLAALVTEAELAKVNEAEWVALNLTVANASNGMANLLSVYKGAYVSAYDYSGGVLITGPAERVRTAIKLMRDFDKPGVGSSVVRTYDLPEGIKADNARLVVAGLFPTEVTEVKQMDTGVSVTSRSIPKVHISVAPVGNRLIVRASSSDHALVQQVIAAMK